MGQVLEEGAGGGRGGPPSRLLLPPHRVLCSVLILHFRLIVRGGRVLFILRWYADEDNCNEAEAEPVERTETTGQWLRVQATFWAPLHMV